MSIFKTIAKVYKVAKENKKICCENVNEALVQISISIQESCKEKQLELLENYKDMYEEYKTNLTNDKCIDLNAFMEYMDGNISKDEYELKNLFFKELVKQSINDVEQGKISHKHFFEIINRRT
jgi:fructose-1,6-bisphosphatase